ncbi:helix-turn-helix transcriptional regulator [Kiloniella laminariae]|uniref:Helix-turn-helix transcriptional regulator n=1 Tax=Kiloniella laminariae TaxID=454162 RepID=A0ABT4LPL6_9PROT|nr:helix-turn-helix transcriptional regulator [Kiloniella laminariae]MCZ4281892.1 helix-turn-helix transcriptional regulator [Kiloniella laminariae]
MRIEPEPGQPLASKPSDMPDRLLRPVMVRAANMRPGRRVLPHSHEWCQLAYASEGVLAVYTDQGSWVVPPERAVWIPHDTVHEVYSPHGSKWRAVHIDNDFAHRMPGSCCVISVSALLKQMLIHAATMPVEYDEGGADGRFMQVLMDQIRAARTVPLHLPMPVDARLRRVTECLITDPSDPRGLEELSVQVGASSRTLARLFSRELGMTFRQWRSQCRLMASMERLALGEQVTTVAIDLGYDSPSAFIAMFKRSLGKPPAAYFGSQ